MSHLQNKVVHDLGDEPGARNDAAGRNDRVGTIRAPANHPKAVFKTMSPKSGKGGVLLCYGTAYHKELNHEKGRIQQQSSVKVG
jgi:hypothetical protein